MQKNAGFLRKRLAKVSTSLAGCGGWGHVFAASAIPTSRAKKWSCHLFSSIVEGGEYGIKYVTSEYLMRVAFVAEIISVV